MSKHHLLNISLIERSGSYRRLRVFRPNSQRAFTLEARLLPAAVFYLAPSPPASGTNQASSQSNVWPANADPNPNPPANDQTASGPAGATVSSQLTNNIIYYEQYGSGGPPMTNMVSATEAGIVGNTDAIPQNSSGGSISQIQVNVTHTNTDSVGTDANGPYDIAGQDMAVTQDTVTRSTAPIHMNISSPVDGVVSIQFNIQVTYSSDPRFGYGAGFGIRTPFVVIAAMTAGQNQSGITVTAADGTVLKSDNNFNTPGPDNHTTFEYDGTFPIAAGTTPTSLDYDSRLVTFPDGVFGSHGGSETATATSGLAYNFTETLPNQQPATASHAQVSAKSANPRPAPQTPGGDGMLMPLDIQMPMVQPMIPSLSSSNHMVSTITPRGPFWGHRSTPVGSVLQSSIGIGNESGEI